MTTTRQETPASVRYTCDCPTHQGAAITAPTGYITGTAKQVRDMVHNYVAMTQSPVMGPVMAARGVKAAA